LVFSTLLNSKFIIAYVLKNPSMLRIVAEVDDKGKMVMFIKSCSSALVMILQILLLEAFSIVVILTFMPFFIVSVVCFTSRDEVELSHFMSPDLLYKCRV
jgi:hypothetical protein